MRWLGGIIDSMDMSLSKVQKIVKDREAWRAAVPVVMQSQHDLPLKDSSTTIKNARKRQSQDSGRFVGRGKSP